jgi:hypothetical protein
MKAKPMSAAGHYNMAELGGYRTSSQASGPR